MKERETTRNFIDPLLGLLMDQPIFGQGSLRILVISPFFVMPTVSALVWKNMLMHLGPMAVFA